MKIWKNILKALFWMLIVVLLVAPVGLIFLISAEEMREYATPTVPVLQEHAIGGIVKASRTDVKEYTTVSGTFISCSYGYMELEYDKVKNVRWYVGSGDEIQEGQIIGSGKQGDVVATMTGIVTEMRTYSQEDCYIKLMLFSPVELSCRVNDRTLSLLKSGSGMTDEDGATVTLSFASKQKNADGTTNIRLSIDTEEYTYGEMVTELIIYSGRIYQKVITLPLNCVYQKEGSEQWYVRQVTESGIFLAEIPVDIGYEIGNQVCVSGINEGDSFDSGYKAVMGG